MKIIFSTMSEADRTAEFAKMDDAALDTYRSEARTEASALFAKDEADLTIADADAATALMASIKHVETEQSVRAAAATKAAESFAAAKAAFSESGHEAGTGAENVTGEGDEGDGEDGEADGDDADADADAEEGDGDEGDGEEVEAAKGENPFPAKKSKDDADDEDDEDKKVTTAAARRSATRLPAASAARKVGTKAKRPASKSAKDAANITITAAADIPGISAGATIDSFDAVGAALMERGKVFPKWNERQALALHSEGITMKDNRVPLASFHIGFDAEVSGGKTKHGATDQSAMKTALERHKEVVTASMLGNEPVKVHGAEPLTAAAWCAPSETIYTWLSDYVVDGLLTIPEVAANRGGLFITQGPQLAQTTWAGDLVDDFGFGGTEADMEAGYVKTFETIECPEFEDHRLDFDGYGWRIPFLTEAAYPELVTDAMRLSNVLYAHKMNRRFINDILALSTAVTTAGLGATFTDTLEALTIIAIKERRWWNLGENQIMEVKLPQHALDIFKMDMSRRAGLALDDIATDQKVAAHFASHRLAVEYISDFQDIHQATIASATWPATIPAIIYPSGTFVKAVKPVVNLSAVYDTASLEENEYTGVFFEQGVMTMKVGYRSHKISIPVNTAGLTGALILDNHPESTNWAGQKAAVVA